MRRKEMLEQREKTREHERCERVNEMPVQSPNTANV